MKYGIYFAYWEKEWDADYIKYMKKAKSLGFDILEISCAALAHASLHDLDQLKSAASEYDIELTAGYGPSPSENLGSPDPEIVKHGLTFYQDILQKLEYLNIHIPGGGIYSYWPVDYSKPVDKEGDWLRSVENVRKVGYIAGECGVDYCLEVLNRFEGYLLNTAWEAKKFVREVDIPSVKIMLDTFHMNIEEDSIPQAIHTAGELLGHFHVGENNRRVPGKGSLPWHTIGCALRDIGYDKAVVMEPFVMNGGRIGQDIRLWRDLSQRGNEETLDQDAAGSLSFLRHVFSGPHHNN